MKAMDVCSTLTWSHQLEKAGIPFDLTEVSAAKVLLRIARDRLRNREPIPDELADYLAEAFDAILAGSNPKQALQLNRSRKGRPKVDNSARNNWIYQRMEELMEECGSARAAAIKLKKEMKPYLIMNVRTIEKIHEEMRGDN